MMQQKILMAIVTSIIAACVSCSNFSERNTADIYTASADPGGNLVVYGHFNTSLDFDPSEGEMVLESIEEYDNFLALYDSDNTLQWVYTWAGYGRVRSGGDASEYVKNIIMDGAGGIYLGGYFNGIRDLDFTDEEDIHESEKLGITDAYSNYGAFISKYNADGSFEWAGSWANPYGADVNATYVAGNGDLFVIGEYEGEMDFDPGPGQKIFSPTHTGKFWEGGEDFYVSRFNPDGTLVSTFTWAYDQGVFTPQFCFVDPDDHFHFIGSATEALDIDPGAGEFIIDPTSGDPIFMCEIDDEGELIHANSIIPSQTELFLNNAAMDSSGDIYLGFSKRKTPASKGKTSYRQERNAYGIVILKIDNTGSNLWSVEWGGDLLGEGAWITGISFDEDENLIVHGYFKGTVDFDPSGETNELTAPSDGQNYTARLNPDGEFIDVEVSEYKQYYWGSSMNTSKISGTMTYDVLDEVRTIRQSNSLSGPFVI
ncbi:MAG TPA: hypothetical protein VGB30_06795 [bacterium]|jgi:hypothetical protein